MFRWELVDLIQLYEILFLLLSDSSQQEIYRKKYKSLLKSVNDIDSKALSIGEDDFFDLEIEDSVGKLDKLVEICFKEKLTMADNLLLELKEELDPEMYSDYVRCLIVVKGKIV